MTEQVHDSCHIPSTPGQSAATEQPLTDVNRHVSSLKTQDVTLKIAVQDVPGMFDAKAPVYLYDTCTDTGQCASSKDELFEQWVTDDEHRIFQLFVVGSLPTCGLRAAVAQGIRKPYWRECLRSLQGWIVCQAHLEQAGDETWCVAHTQVLYTQDDSKEETMVRTGASSTAITRTPRCSCLRPFHSPGPKATK
jgi:hypothetical protein